MPSRDLVIAREQTRPMYRLVTLRLGNRILGVRYYLDEDHKRAIDIDLGTLKDAGVYNYALRGTVPLIEDGDLLITQEEKDGTLEVLDLSEQQQIAELQKLRNHPIYKYLFEVPNPISLTYQDFVNNKNWSTVPDTRPNPEVLGRRHLICPSGRQYRGGYIGKGNENLVKTNFYEESIYWHLHSGLLLEEHHLGLYPSVDHLVKNLESMLPYIDIKLPEEIKNSRIKSMNVDTFKKLRVMVLGKYTIPIDILMAAPYQARGAFAEPAKELQRKPEFQNYKSNYKAKEDYSAMSLDLRECLYIATKMKASRVMYDFNVTMYALLSHYYLAFAPVKVDAYYDKNDPNRNEIARI